MLAGVNEPLDSPDGSDIDSVGGVVGDALGAGNKDPLMSTVSRMDWSGVTPPFPGGALVCAHSVSTELRAAVLNLGTTRCRSY